MGFMEALTACGIKQHLGLVGEHARDVTANQIAQFYQRSIEVVA